MKRHGFTLVQLLVVISILGILASIVFMGVSTAREKARMTSLLVLEERIRSSVGQKVLGMWSLDGSPNDGTPSANNGVIAGVSDWRAASQCIRGSCLNFDGSTRFDVDQMTSVQSRSKRTFTFMVWFKPETQNAGMLVDGYMMNGAMVWSALVQNSNANLWYNLGLDGAGVGESLYAVSPTANKWHLLVITYTGGNTFNAYVDGILDATFTRSTVTTNLYANITLGSKENGTDKYRGLLDEAILFSDPIEFD